jgi:hypothetical protein
MKTIEECAAELFEAKLKGHKFGYWESERGTVSLMHYKTTWKQKNGNRVQDVIYYRVARFAKKEGKKYSLICLMTFHQALEFMKNNWEDVINNEEENQ